MVRKESRTHSPEDCFGSDLPVIILGDWQLHCQLRLSMPPELTLSQSTQTTVNMSSDVLNCYYLIIINI